MATLESPVFTLTAEPPGDVQPGGHGPFVRLELLWGHLRRIWLRRFRPDYVRRMLELRQGNHPDCPFDIIDSRDLKFCRNVCGFWFRPEDDPFRHRGELGFARYGFAELVGFSVIFLAIGLFCAVAAWWWSPWFALALVPVALLEAEILWFFRDPPRRIPSDPDALVSPADGTVTHVDEVSDPDFSDGQVLRVSIFLSVFNVHVNRLPRAGRVVDVRYFRGEFLDARHNDCGRRNEQLWLDLEEWDGRRLRVKQVSGAIARRIVCWAKVGETFRTGDRYGMIKFGSRTDVLVPIEAGIEVLVRPGDKVRGGNTVLLRRPPGGPA
jgi:phosphatidylserine decarboxylase